MMSFAPVSRPLFTTTPSVDYAPWVKDHMSNVQSLVNHILGNESSRETSHGRESHRSEEIHIHHHHHRYGWDYEWGGPWWGWGGPSYSPVIINNGGSDRREKDEDHTALAIVSSIAFFALSFFCGKSYYAYNGYTEQLNEHVRFTTEFNTAAKKFADSEPPKELGTIGYINTEANSLLVKRQDEAFKNLALLISGLATSLFIATGSIFKIAMLRYTGLFLIFPIGGYALFRLGMGWNDNSEQKQAQKIQAALALFRTL